MIAPGRAIGVLGGGQLGRMFAQAAQTLGYKVHVYEPVGPCPAGCVADREFNAPYEDRKALAEFAGTVDVVTYEFENIPTEPLTAIEAIVPLRPGREVLRTCQNRTREKAWLKANGFPHARYAEALEGDIVPAAREVGLPCVVKTADFGYDGKGQMKIAGEEDLEKAAAIFRGRRCVVEQWITFSCEISVICARGMDGVAAVLPVAENRHTNHILDVSIVPARIGEAAAEKARALALDIAERLGVVGLLAVEMFLTETGEVLVNEMAPRPHNSGHWSIDGALTSQFEQHVRAVCGLPLGPMGLRQPTVMVNILGDAWKKKGGEVTEPDWSAILAVPGAKLHLYGKPDPRPGRKMGHFTVQAPDVERALDLALKVKARL